MRRQVMSPLRAHELAFPSESLLGAPHHRPAAPPHARKHARVHRLSDCICASARELCTFAAAVVLLRGATTPALGDASGRGGRNQEHINDTSSVNTSTTRKQNPTLTQKYRFLVTEIKRC